MKIKTKIAINIILLVYKWIEPEYKTDIFISNLIKTRKRNSIRDESINHDEVKSGGKDALCALESRIYMHLSALNTAETDLERLKLFFNHSHSEGMAILKLIGNIKN